MTRPALLLMLVRGASWRCPWCGTRRAFFTGWFAKVPSCPGCGLRWRRGDVGFELGAATMAVMITFGSLLAALAVALVVTWPEVAVVPLVVVLGVCGVVIPIAVYPITYTCWQALDLVMRPVSADDFADLPGP
jgi:uncharacterized protein (DUF983 family)